MRLTVLKIQKYESKYGQHFWYVFLKGDNGASFKSCVSPLYGNWLRNRWVDVIQYGVGCILQYPNMPTNAKGLLNADISFNLLPPQKNKDNSEITDEKTTTTSPAPSQILS